MLLKEHADARIELGVSLSQLKKIYVALFRQLHNSSLSAIDEVDEDDMLLTIQTYLQRRARAAGVDGTDHAAWEAFLGVGDGPSCAARANRRREGDERESPAA